MHFHIILLSPSWPPNLRLSDMFQHWRCHLHYSHMLLPSYFVNIPHVENVPTNFSEANCYYREPIFFYEIFQKKINKLINLDMSPIQSSYYIDILPSEANRFSRSRGESRVESSYATGRCPEKEIKCFGRSKFIPRSFL
jgi:hypothetical protein